MIARIERAGDVAVLVKQGGGNVAIGVAGTGRSLFSKANIPEEYTEPRSHDRLLRKVEAKAKVVHLETKPPRATKTPASVRLGKRRAKASS